MSNDDDIDNDLDIDTFDDDAGFDDFRQKNSLGELWNNPMVKIGIVLAAFSVVVGAIILFGGSSDPRGVSVVSNAPNISEAPGTSEVSETMRESLEQANIERTEEALRSSGSAIPTPISPPRGALPLEIEQPSGEDPLERWRRMQEERIRQQETSQPRPSQGQPAQVDTRTPAVNAVAQSMSTQMQAVLQNQRVVRPSHKSITGVDFLEAAERRKIEAYERQQRALLASTGGGGGGGTLRGIEKIIIPAGTIEYGQLLIEANTDAPGPILAQIVSGPLRGARVLGSFQSSHDYITLNFNQVVIDGLNYQIQAVAVDPDTTLPGMVTEKDRKILSRVILPMAAEFVSGLASAVSESGTTTIYIDGNTAVSSTSDRDGRQEVATGIDAAGRRLSSILNQEASQIRPMLRIAAGTPIGILFISPVSDLAEYQ